MSSSVTVFAPATCANVAVGFDLLGFPLDNVGDWVTVSKISTPTVEIESVTGVVDGLPLDPAKNTATVGLIELLREHHPGFGFRVAIKKGIPLGSGMGGSAASAVGALVGANALLSRSLSREQVLKYALQGELVASGAAHPDNVAPCLYGGLTLTRSIDPIEVVSIPVPERVLCVLVHPHLRVDTRTARKVLKPTLPLIRHVRQSANLAGFLAGCYRDDLGLIKRSMSDVLIEPQRAHLITGFEDAQKAALDHGALGCSISGSGPSVFAWVASPEDAEKTRSAITKAFLKHKIKSDSWISPVNRDGAKILQ